MLFPNRFHDITYKLCSICLFFRTRVARKEADEFWYKFFPTQPLEGEKQVPIVTCHSFEMDHVLTVTISCRKSVSGTVTSFNRKSITAEVSMCDRIVDVKSSLVLIN